MEGRYRTALGRARGLGAAGHGAGAWLSERVTSLALVPLVLWIVYAALQLAGAGYDGAVEWVREPLKSCAMALATTPVATIEIPCHLAGKSRFCEKNGNTLVSNRSRTRLVWSPS